MRGRKRCDLILGCSGFYDQHLDNCPHCGAQEMFSDLIPYNPLDWIYDIETYPNFFSCALKHVQSGTRLFFEFSDWMNQLPDLVNTLRQMQQDGCRMVGFNNVGFDYPILHAMINNYPHVTVTDIYQHCQRIINTPWENRFANVVWNSEVMIPQIDLFKVHHFDNKSRRTSLKMLEFNMHADSIQDLPFPPGTVLTWDQAEIMRGYNWHDVDQTEKFYFESLDAIEFRETLSAKHNRDFLNFNDTKIGKEFFIMELERLHPGICYDRTSGVKEPRQTYRGQIALRDVIFPYISFKRPEFTQMLQWFQAQTITETKGVFKELSTMVDGFKYVFGVGGIHGSVDPQTVVSTEKYVIVDWDVKSYYPKLAIANRLHPEHLGTIFCDVYADLYEQRDEHAKGTPINRALKLSLNGTYGETNNPYSPFYDPQFTMAITINGQLLLCMLAEWLLDVPGLQLIQANTDGLTVRVPRNFQDEMTRICKAWEEFTCLDLESVTYSRMFIRDVNNYIGEYENGDLKRKGAYEYEREWHQNHSAMIVPRAAEAALVRGEDITTFITQHDDIHDFMLRTKINRQDDLVLEDITGEYPQQKITRYYVARLGGALTKISPPPAGYQVGQWKRANSLTDAYYSSVIHELMQGWTVVDLDSTGVPWDERINTKNRSTYQMRRTAIEAGFLVSPCNEISMANRGNINYEYYIAEAKKLVDILR